MVRNARVALAGLYEQTGRAAEATFVSAATDPADATVPERLLRLDRRQARVSALRILRDTTVTRGLRLEVANYTLAYTPCGDLRQILFGVDAQQALEMENARKALVRFPSDSVLFLKASLALERPMRDGFGDGGLDFRVLNVIARVVDFLTGSRRMESCVSMLS